MTLEEAYDEFMGELPMQYQEDKVLAAECSHCVRSKLPPKREDPERFTVPCCIGKAKERALCDFGSSISLMPLTFAKKWNVGKLTTNETMKLVLADQSTLNPSVIIKDVPVKIKDLVFPIDFVIVDIEEDADIPIILGRPFLVTSCALIDMERKELTLRMGAQERLIKVYKDEIDWCFMIDVRDKLKNVPQTAGWKMKVQLEELEEDMSQLTMEEEPLL
ncbi:hypothetical protein A2U01_0035258 [Trifolium medium]|uniref:Aspartic peptidase DDI1-type domain-containing protein n=1 Tax=Trifolium medium TaxID=97028 RepID=A0A392PPW7_9FABA|nr:hypothetical protein [Trifolium medium]